MKKIFAGLLVATALLTGSAFAADPIHNAPVWGNDNTSSSVTAGGYTSLGYVYDPVNYTWNKGTDTGSDEFMVSANVEMWCDMAFEKTDINFHIGKDMGVAPTMSDTIDGYLSSNNGQYLFICCTSNNETSEAGLTNLVFKNNIFGGQTPANVAPIPVKWELADKGAYREGTYSEDGNNGNLKGITWLLDNGDAGYHAFTIKCTISPDRYQPDGQYELDPILAAAPVL